MRQRITYLLSESDINPADIEIGETELTYAKSKAEERRITLAFEDLPLELRSFLDEFHELHIRLASNKNYRALSPTVSRVPAGLHVFFTLRKTATDTQLCSRLEEVLGADVKCSSSPDSFSKPPILSERFASTAAYQFYHSPSDLSKVSAHLESVLCPALAAAVEANTVPRFLCDALITARSAAYVDYDYDAISHALNIVVLWDTQDTPDPWRVSARKLNSEDRLEVGVLQSERATEPEEISMGGFLTVVGEDDHPSPTLFSFPARHHPLPSSDKTAFTASFQSPTGLHPKMDITFPLRGLTAPRESCALHAYYTLPSFVFIDRYQFADPLFLASQNLVALRSLSGEEDPEAPNWAVKQWGSAALFELAKPSPETTSGNWTATVPMHLRYIDKITSGTGGAELELPWPVVFWACEAEEGLKMATNPFDRVNLGYDGLFGPKTMFYHVPAAPTVEQLVASLVVPTISSEHQWVPAGTAVAVLVGFVWILWKLTMSASPGKAKAKTK